MSLRSITIVSGIYPPDVGGPAGYVPRVAKWLHSQGIKVNVVTLSDEPNFEGQDSYPVHRIRRGAFWPLRFFLTVVTIARLSKNSDLIFANGLNFECFLASILARRPVIHKIVGDYAWERARNRRWFLGTIDQYQSASKGLWLRFFDVVRTLPLLFSKGIITPSQYLAGIVKGWGVSDRLIEVVYNSHEALKTQSGLKIPEFSGYTVVTACRLVPWKGVASIIDTVARRGDLRLIIAGHGPLRAELEALAQTLNVSERVVFLGDVSRQNMSSVYLAGDVFILNSTYEGLPHVVLEAQSLGLPVVASRVGGTPEVVIDGFNGLLVPPENNEALADAIFRVLDDPLLRQTFSANALTHSQQFSEAAMLRQTLAFMEARLGLGASTSCSSLPASPR